MFLTRLYFYNEVIEMLVDIIVILVLIAGTIIGIKRGVFKMCAPLISCALSLVLAIFLSSSIAGFVIDSFINPSIENVIVETAETTGVSGVIDGLKSLSLPEIDEDNPISELLSTGVLSGVKDTLDLSFIKQIPANISVEKLTDSILNALRVPLEAIIAPICFGFVLILSTIVLRIILGLLTSVLDNLVIVKSLSALLGGIIGLAMSVLFALVAVSVIPRFIDEGSDIRTAIESSVSGSIANEFVAHLSEVKF